MPDMRTTTIQVRIQPAEKEAFARSAELAGVSISTWTRERLRMAALSELKAAAHDGSQVHVDPPPSSYPAVCNLAASPRQGPYRLIVLVESMTQGRDPPGQEAVI